jgi:hypothetical protein
LQSKFTLLPRNFFPAKIPFSKIQKKILEGKNFFWQKSEFYFAKERGPFMKHELASRLELRKAFSGKALRFKKT